MSWQLRAFGFHLDFIKSHHYTCHLDPPVWVACFQGENDNLPEILKMAVLALHPDAPDLRVAALAASKVVAENGANKGDHPAVIRKDHGIIWNDVERDETGWPGR